MATTLHSSAHIWWGTPRRVLRTRSLRPRWRDAMVVVMLLVNCVVAQESLLGAAVVKAFAARYGEDARQRLHDWERLMLANRNAPVDEKLAQVNGFFNQLPWLTDDEHWGRRDYWATPLEMIGTYGGDCEDFSIAKYISLVKMGVRTDQLRITYVRAPRLRQTHMVLAYYPSPKAVPLILDNLDKTIRPATERPDLIPVYSFNADGLWANGGVGNSRRVGGASRLEAWREVARRMRLEGVEASG